MRGGLTAGLITAIGVGWVSPLVGQDRGTLSAVDRYVRDEVRREHVPGVSVAVVRGGRVVLARGYGQANVELHVPATDSTVTPATAAETVGARLPTDDEAAELHIRSGAVLTIDRVTRDTTGRPIE